MCVCVFVCVCVYVCVWVQVLGLNIACVFVLAAVSRNIYCMVSLFKSTGNDLW